MKTFLITLLFLLPLTSYAEIYKSVDANGNVTYTDKPTDSNATVVTVPKTNSAPATSPEPASVNNAAPENNAAPVTAAPSDKPTKKPYTQFMIASPADQESIQNQPTLAVTIKINPSLQAGDVIQLYLDGTPYGNAVPDTSFNLTIPNRGTHVLSATLFDKNMQVLKQGNSITIYVHQAHI